MAIFQVKMEDVNFVMCPTICAVTGTEFRCGRMVLRCKPKKKVTELQPFFSQLMTSRKKGHHPLYQLWCYRWSE